MSGVSIEGLGLAFVWECFKEYWGSCAFGFIFLIGMLFAVIIKKDKISRMFLWYTIFLVLTVYNPVLVKIIIPILNFDNEYYRFFWILPVIPVLAYYITALIWKINGTLKKGICLAAILLVLAFLGTPIQGVVTNFSMIENIYKVPNDLRAVCDVIHADSEKENPNVIFSNELNTVARQYDASLNLVLHRDAVLFRSGSTVATKYREDNKWYQRQKTLLDVVYYEMDMEPEVFKKALQETGTDYLVLTVNLSNHDFIRACGAEAIAQTDGYVVYRWQNP